MSLLRFADLPAATPMSPRELLELSTELEAGWERARNAITRASVVDRHPLASQPEPDRIARLGRRIAFLRVLRLAWECERFETPTRARRWPALARLTRRTIGELIADASETEEIDEEILAWLDRLVLAVERHLQAGRSIRGAIPRGPARAPGRLAAAGSPVVCSTVEPASDAVVRRAPERPTTSAPLGGEAAGADHRPRSLVVDIDGQSVLLRVCRECARPLTGRLSGAPGPALVRIHDPVASGPVRSIVAWPRGADGRLDLLRWASVSIRPGADRPFVARVVARGSGARGPVQAGTPARERVDHRATEGVRAS